MEQRICEGYKLLVDTVLPIIIDAEFLCYNIDYHIDSFAKERCEQDCKLYKYNCVLEKILNYGTNRCNNIKWNN